MKKLAFFMFVIILSLIIIPQFFSKKADGAEDYQVIPDEAIRLRILANSDSKEDQRIKRKVRDAVSIEIEKWVKDIDDIEEARALIESRQDDIKQIVASTLNKHQYDKSFSVEYSDKVQFPTKLYGSYVYPAGEYEAVLISIGKGEGANWWCVLFPPLCFLDFSFGATVGDEAEAKAKVQPEKEKPEVKFFLLEWLGLS